MEQEAKRRRLGERVIEELRVFWVLVLYLWLFLGSFVLYRRLVLAELGRNTYITALR